MASEFSRLDKHSPRPPRAPSICDKCNSGSYCANRAPGMTDCENYNKFPRSSHGESYR